MTRQTRLEELFHAASELPTAQREAFARNACGDDQALCAELLALLGRDRERTPTYLKPQVNAQLLRHDPERIGRYRILERVGEGGMGVVYVAEQTEPVRRRVALKVIRAGMDTDQALARFEAERQALALMDHPSIAKIYDAGATETGRPYYVMEYTAGLPIHQHCDRQRLDMPARLRLFLQVCDAVQHAHQRGVIHRDLKPSNVLVSTASGTATAKVIDFGIARPAAQPLTSKAIHTRLDEVIGTFDYMSPEQAEGGSDVDTRTDIYALGVMLYELLTGELPFGEEHLHAKSISEVRSILRAKEPLRPSSRVTRLGEAGSAIATLRATDRPSLARHLRGDLDWIVLKAMAKDRERRYASASELAADLRRHLAREPVLASPPGARYRIGRFIARNRAAVVSAGLVLAALGLGLVGTSLGLHRARAERELADRRAEQLRQQLYATNVTLAMHALETGDALGADRLLSACPEDLRGFEWRFLDWSRNRALAKVPLGEHSGTALTLHLDGRRFVLGLESGQLVIVDPERGTISAPQPLLSDRIHKLTASRDRRVLLVGAEDGAWSLVDGGTLQEIKPLARAADQVRNIALDPDGQRVAMLRGDQTVELLSLVDGTRKPLDAPPQPFEVFMLAFSPDGRSLAGGGSDLCVWDTTSGRLLATADEPRRLWREGEPQQYQPRVAGLTYSGDGRMLALGVSRPNNAPTGADNRIEFRNPLTLATLQVMNRREATVITDLAFSPDHATLAADGSFQLFLCGLEGDWQQVHVPGHTTALRGVAYRADGRTLASISPTELLLWPAAMPTAPSTVPTWLPTSRSIWSAKRTRVASPIWSLSGSVVLDTRTTEVVRAVVAPSLPARALALTPDDATLIAAGEGKTSIIDLATGRRVGEFEGAGLPTRGLVTRDGATFVAAYADGSLRTFDMVSRKQLGELVNQAPVSAMVELTGSTGVAVARATGQIELVAVPVPQHQLRWPTTPDILSLSAHPDGRHLLAVNRQHDALVLDLHTGQSRTLATGIVNDAALSPDGTRVALVDRQWFTSLVDFATGRELLSRMPGNTRHTEVQFRADGSGLIGLGQLMTLWDIAPSPDDVIARENARRGMNAYSRLRQRHVVNAAMQPAIAQERLTPQTRAVVLDLMERVGDCAFDLNHEAWYRVVRSYLGKDEYQLALTAAETAYRLCPVPGLLNTLATAHLRMGNFDTAARMSSELLATNSKAGTPASPFDLAVLCIAQARLGQRAAAEASLDALRQAVRTPPHDGDGQAWAFLREAEATLSSTNR